MGALNKNIPGARSPRDEIYSTSFQTSQFRNESSLCKYKNMKNQRYNKPNSIKELETLIFAEKVKKFKDQPYLLKQKYTDETANGLTKCICDFIRLHGGQAERINSMGRPIDRRQTFTDVVGITRTIGSVEWVPGTTTAGTADVSATIRGRSVKIEIKIGTDRQSEAQKQYQQKIETAGGIYYIARDFTTFLNWYKYTFEK